MLSRGGDDRGSTSTTGAQRQGLNDRGGVSSVESPAVTIATHMLTFLSVLGLRPSLKNATASQFPRLKLRDNARRHSICSLHHWQTNPSQSGQRKCRARES